MTLLGSFVRCRIRALSLFVLVLAGFSRAVAFYLFFRLFSRSFGLCLVCLVRAVVPCGFCCFSFVVLALGRLFSAVTFRLRFLLVCCRRLVLDDNRNSSVRRI